MDNRHQTQRGPDRGIILPQVKLKNTLNMTGDKRGSFRQGAFGATHDSGFGGLKRNMLDRHASKANVGDHLKHKKGRGGS